VKKSACGSGIARDIATQSCSYRGQSRSHNEKSTTSEAIDEFIPKEKLTAYERWELDDFGSSRPSRPVRLAEKTNPPASTGQEPTISFPTADEIERIHQEAHKLGYAAGYEEGTARVRMEALRLHTLADDIDKALARVDQELAQETLALAIEVARQVVRQTLQIKPEVVLEVVREALAQLPHHHTSIYLHPEDASLVRRYVGDQLAHAGHRILEDALLTRGGCRVEASGSQIDATLETRWRRVMEVLGRRSSWLDPSPE